MFVAWRGMTDRACQRSQPKHGQAGEPAVALRTYTTTQDRPTSDARNTVHTIPFLLNTQAVISSTGFPPANGTDHVCIMLLQTWPMLCHALLLCSSDSPAGVSVVKGPSDRPPVWEASIVPSREHCDIVRRQSVARTIAVSDRKSTSYLPFIEGCSHISAVVVPRYTKQRACLNPLYHGTGTSDRPPPSKSGGLSSTRSLAAAIDGE